MTWRCRHVPGRTDWPRISRVSNPVRLRTKDTRTIPLDV